MSKEKLKPFEVTFNQVDPEHPSLPVMTSKIIYGTDIADALYVFLNNSSAHDIKKIQEFSNKKSGARLKW